MKSFQESTVKEKFDSFPKEHKKALLAIRELVFDVAQSTEGVGPLVETLKWAQPSYITEKSKSGSTVRVDRFGEHKVAIFFHCQTTLVDSFRGIFPHLVYSGNRAIVLDPHEPIPEFELRACIEMSLLYKLKKRRRNSYGH